MSHHFARVVEPMQAVCDGRNVSVAVKTPIRNVRLSDNGRYYFEARSLGEWRQLFTEEDLPAFTDKGREGRAEQSARARAAELRVGRPTKSNAPATTTVSIRVTQSQKRELRESAKKADVSLSDAVLGALVSMKMVTP